MASAAPMAEGKEDEPKERSISSGDVMILLLSRWCENREGLNVSRVMILMGNSALLAEGRMERVERKAEREYIQRVNFNG